MRTEKILGLQCFVVPMDTMRHTLRNAEVGNRSLCQFCPVDSQYASLVNFCEQHCKGDHVFAECDTWTKWKLKHA